MTEGPNPVPGQPPLPPGKDRGHVQGLLDGLERLLVLLLYGWLLVRVVASVRVDGQPANLLLLVSESLVVLLVLLRRPAAAISQRPGDWVVAIAATCGPLLASPGSGPPLLPPAVGSAFLLTGMVVQIAALLALGRSLGCVPAHRGLKRGGPYRVVRHPLYAGHLLSHLGFVALNPSAWNAGLWVACVGLQILRLRTEERLLALDPGYDDYRAAVRYRLIPWVF